MSVWKRLRFERWVVHVCSMFVADVSSVSHWKGFVKFFFLFGGQNMSALENLLP